MVTTEVHQVTSHNKTKQSKWDIQEAIRKVVKESVEEANNNNVARMLQESTTLNLTSDKEVPTDTLEEDVTWKVLAGCYRTRCMKSEGGML